MSQPPREVEKSVPTFWVRIYMSGPIDVANQVCRQDCLREGLCVTVEPTLFIYTGGEETGFVVGLVNYPRFPTTLEALTLRAQQLARLLLDATCQHSALIMAPEMTQWITRREQVVERPQEPRTILDRLRAIGITVTPEMQLGYPFDVTLAHIEALLDTSTK